MNCPLRPPTALLALACLALAAAPSSAQAQMTFTPGDIILGFQATGGDGSSNTYLYNLGQGPGFRDGTTTGVIANIGTDLAGTYGLAWFERSDVYWGIAGVRDPAAGGPNTVVNGDAKATIYVSRIAPNGPGTSTQWILASGPTVISAATSISTMQFGYNTTNGSDVITPETQRTPTPSSNGRGTVQGTGDINNWSVFNPVGGPAFGNVLTGGVQAPLGGGATTHWLDLYRIMGRSSASATPNTPLGEGLLVGSFSLTANGEVRFQPPSTPSDPYDSWADSFGLAGNERNFDADVDGDTLENGVEFVVGGNPKVAADADKAPVITRDEQAVTVVYRRVAAAADFAIAVQSTTTPFSGWTPAVNGTGGVTVVTEPDGFGSGVDRITVRIPWTPAVSPSIFTRLAVESKP
ncbi:MAG: hypothetical protein ACKV19_20125 [Verrucomicrobiales bacterium]